MDELGRVIAALMKDAGAGQTPSSAAPGPPDPGPSPAAVPSVKDLAGLMGGGLPSAAPGGFPGGFPGFPGDRRLQLLQALRPFLREERRPRLDRLCRLLRTASGVRGALQSLGGIQHV